MVGVNPVWDRRARKLLVMDEPARVISPDGSVTIRPLPPRVALDTVPGTGRIAYLSSRLDKLELLTDEFEILEELRLPDGLGPVQRTVVAPDGRWVLASLAGGMVVWSISPGGASEGRVLGPSPGPDIDPIAVADGCDCALWASPVDPSTGKRTLLRASLRGAAAPRVLAAVDTKLFNLQISPDGQLATFSDRRESIGWDLASDQELWRKVAGMQPNVTAQTLKRVRLADRAIFSRDGRRLIGAFEDGVGELDARSGELVGWYGYATRTPLAMLLAADHLYVNYGHRIYDWSMQTGRVVGQANNPVLGRGVTIRDDGKMVIAYPRIPDGCPAGQVSSAVVVLPGPMASGMRIAADGRYAGAWWQGATPGWGWPVKGDAAVYCTAEPMIYWDLKFGRAAIYDPTGARDVRVVDLASGREVPLVGSRGDRFMSLTTLFSPRGTYIVLPTSLERGGLDLWNVATGASVASGMVVAGVDNSLTFMIRGMTISPDERRMAVLRGARVDILGLPGGDDPVAVPVPEGATAFEFSGDSQTLFVGTDDGQLLAVRDGAVVGRRKGGGGGVTDLTVARDGRRIATSHRDAGIRVWDPATLALQATLYAYEDDEYLVTTPGGAHVGSPEAAGRIVWTFSDPIEQFGFSQFSQYNDPRIVAARLAGEDVDIEGTPGRPPRVELVNAPGSSQVTDRVSLNIRARSSTRVDEVRVFVEGRPIATRDVCAPEAELAIDVPLLPGKNHVEVIAFDAQGVASNAATVELSREAAATSDLWIVAAGIDAYPRLPGFQLHHAASDARAVAAAFESAAAPTYVNVHRTTLTDGEASVSAIVSALERLAEMREGDIAVVFLSGHGVKRATDGDMVFLTTESALGDDGNWRGSIEWATLSGALDRAKGRILLLLDACHAGHVTQELLAPNNEFAAGLFASGRSGTIIFAASKGRQVSFEPGGTRGVTIVQASRTPVGEHGLFTAAVLAALGDERLDRDGDGALQLAEFIDDVTLRVSEASQGHQTPWVARREIFGDFQLLGPRVRK